MVPTEVMDRDERLSIARRQITESLQKIKENVNSRPGDDYQLARKSLLGISLWIQEHDEVTLRQLRAVNTYHQVISRGFSC